MTFQELLSMNFVNAQNELNEDLENDLNDIGLAVKKAGFSEWVSTTSPKASISFSFFSRENKLNKCLFLGPSDICGNIMLTDTKGSDLGQNNIDVIRIWLEMFEWETSLARIYL
jgi:hypothetical protein